jgi:hypothetical protein
VNILTRLMRLRADGGIHRGAHHPAVWERAVTLAKLMPHLEITEFSITANSNCPKVDLIIANEGREIDFPDSGTYTLEDLWRAQLEPRPKFETFASHIGLLAKFFPQLVRKKRSNGVVTLIFK